MRSNTTLEVSRNTSIIGIRCFTKINIYIRSSSNSTFRIYCYNTNLCRRTIGSCYNTSITKYCWDSNISTSIKSSSNTNTNYIPININISCGCQFSSSISITSNSTNKIIGVNIIPLKTCCTQIICVCYRRSYITGNLKFWCWISGSNTEITIRSKNHPIGKICSYSYFIKSKRIIWYTAGS